MKFVNLKYIPGNYPTPMIIMNESKDKKIFEDSYEIKYGDWTERYKHIWTLDAYIIYDQEKIIAYRFNQVSNFFWLLRKLNMSLSFQINNEIDLHEHKQEVKQF